MKTSMTANEQILNTRAKYILDQADCRSCDNGWSLSAKWEFSDGSSVEKDGRGYVADRGDAVDALTASAKQGSPAICI